MNLEAKKIEAFIETLTGQRNAALNTAASVNADLQVALIRIKELEEIAKKTPPK